jgi:uncharacterized membrane protein
MANMNRWEQVASVAVGSVVLAAAAARGRGTPRLVAALAGGGLVARGVSGYCPVKAAARQAARAQDTRQALGGSRGVHIRERITIRQPADALFSFWRDFDNLVQVMPFLDRVDRIDDLRSHWVVRGPAGTTFEWDARIINEIPSEVIAWQSLPGGDVASAGSVRFDAAGDGSTSTQVTVTMQYAPPAGRVGASIAGIIGTSPAAQVRQALEDLKQVFEAGARPEGDETRARAQTELAAIRT